MTRRGLKTHSCRKSSFDSWSTEHRQQHMYPPNAPRTLGSLARGHEGEKESVQPLQLFQIRLLLRLVLQYLYSSRERFNNAQFQTPTILGNICGKPAARQGAQLFTTTAQTPSLPAHVPLCCPSL